MKTWKTIGTVLAVLAALALTVLPPGSAEEATNVEQMIANAKTAADHEAIAAFYEKEAQAAHAKHLQHQKMSDSYAKIPVLEKKAGAVAHCNTIAKNYAEMAKEYEALAHMHREMAKQAE